MAMLNIDSWTAILLERIKSENISLDFTGSSVITKMRKIRGVFTVDKLRSREDGLFDRIYIEYEFFNPIDGADVWVSEIKEFGWFIRVQYAVNKHEECPIPSIQNGGYCNLFDLTEYVHKNDDFVDTIGSFSLGEAPPRIAVRLAELGDFLAEAIPIFMEKKVKPRLGLKNESPRPQ